METDREAFAKLDASLAGAKLRRVAPFPSSPVRATISRSFFGRLHIDLRKTRVRATELFCGGRLRARQGSRPNSCLPPAGGGHRSCRMRW
jgi:hypothetical protein